MIEEVFSCRSYEVYYTVVLSLAVRISSGPPERERVDEGLSIDGTRSDEQR
jgi:hypothetical protein